MCSFFYRYHFGSVLRLYLKWPLNVILSRCLSFPTTTAGSRLARSKNLSGTPTTTSVSLPLSRPGSGGVKPDAALQLTRDGDSKRVTLEPVKLQLRGQLLMETLPLILPLFSIALSLGKWGAGFVVLKMRRNETSEASTAAGALVQGHQGRRRRDLIGLPPWISHASVM